VTSKAALSGDGPSTQRPTVSRLTLVCALHYDSAMCHRIACIISWIGAVVALASTEANAKTAPREIAPPEFQNRTESLASAPGYELKRADLAQLFPEPGAQVHWIERGDIRAVVIVLGDRCFYYAGNKQGQLGAGYRLQAFWLDAGGQRLPKSEPLGAHRATENPKVTSSMTSANGTRMARTSDFGMRVREIRPPPTGAAALGIDLIIELPQGKQVHPLTFKMPLMGS
jgi:hypothetical protein